MLINYIYTNTARLKGVTRRESQHELISFDLPACFSTFHTFIASTLLVRRVYILYTVLAANETQPAYITLVRVPLATECVARRCNFFAPSSPFFLRLDLSSSRANFQSSCFLREKKTVSFSCLLYQTWRERRKKQKRSLLPIFLTWVTAAHVGIGHLVSSLVSSRSA